MGDYGLSDAMMPSSYGSDQDMSDFFEAALAAGGDAKAVSGTGSKEK